MQSKNDFSYLSKPMKQSKVVSPEKSVSPYDYLSKPMSIKKKEEKEGIRGIGKDIYESFAEPLSHPVETAKNLASGLISESLGLGKQAIKLPFEAVTGNVPRLTKNLAQGFEDFVNLPATAAGYLGKKGILFPEDIKQKSWINVNPFEMPKEQESGDIFAQGLPGMALTGPMAELAQLGRVPKALTRSAQAGAVAVSQEQNPIHAAIIANLLSGAPALGNKLKRTSIEKKLNLEEQNLADIENILKQKEAYASHNFGSKNPERLGLKLENTSDELQNAIQELNSFPEANQGPLQPSHLIEENAKKALEEAKTQISEFGGKGKNFQRRISDLLMDELRGEKNPETGKRHYGFMQAIGNRYEVLENKLKNNKITITKTPDLEKLAQQIEKQLPELPKEAKEQILTKWSNELTKSKEVNADSLLRSYRELKHQVNKANEKAYSPGVSPETHDLWIKKASNLKSSLNEMKSILDNNLGGQYLSELANIDKQYAQFVAPLYENPIYNAAKKGKMVSNPLQEISLNMPGNETLRMILNKNPQLQQLLFGEQFAAKPEKLLNPNENVDVLAQMNPKIAELREALIEKESQLQPKLEQASNVKQIEKLKSEIPTYQDKINKMNESIDEIKSLLDNKKITKQKRDELKAKLDKKQKNRDDMMRLFKIHTYLKIFRPF